MWETESKNGINVKKADVFILVCVDDRVQGPEKGTQCKYLCIMCQCFTGCFLSVSFSRNTFGLHRLFTNKTQWKKGTEDWKRMKNVISFDFGCLLIISTEEWNSKRYAENYYFPLNGNGKWNRPCIHFQEDVSSYISCPMQRARERETTAHRPQACDRWESWREYNTKAHKWISI